MVKKGFSVITAILLLLIAVTALYSASLTWKWGDTVVTTSDIVFHSYSMTSALGAAKLYVNVSLDYSVYQACYDVIKGFDMSKNEDDFKSEFQSKIKEYINRYTKPEYKFLTDYKVNIYEYDDVKIKTLNPLRIRITGKDLFIRFEDTIRGLDMTMESNSTIDNTFKIDCYGIYNKGKEIYINTKATLEKEIKKKVDDSWPKTSPALPNLDDLKKQIESMPDFAYDETQGNYKIKSVFWKTKVEFNKWDQSGSEPYKDIKYKVTVKLNVTVQDKRPDQVFPIYDGKKVTFAPLKAEFVFDHVYSS